MHCLLVDDETGIREGLAALLRKKGHVVHTAGDCAAATALLRDHDFDLVVTDWRLPDGTAADFVDGARCPVVAVSGHPEEVERRPAVRAVLTKPLLPAKLMEVLQQHAVAAPRAAAAPALPVDVQRLHDAVAALLGAPPAVEDDGTFVVLRAALPGDAVLPALAELGGDLRVLTPGGRPTLELRCYRDGRPGPMPVVRLAAAWPAVREFAVDCDGGEVTTAAFLAGLERRAQRVAAGAVVHFLNVPEALRSLATSQGRSLDLPMRAKPGPRLPAVLADLWS